MRRSTREFVVPPLIAAFVFSGCMSVAPHDTRTAEGIERVVPGPSRGFGYFSPGFIARSDFYGEFDGIEAGTGGTVTFPLAPGILYVALVAVLLAAAAEGGADLDLSGLDIGSGGGDGQVWHSGFSDPSNVLLSELSFDFTFSGTRHRDNLLGGHLNYQSFLLGMRIGGPRRYVPRYYFSGGWGWYGFQYDNRPDAHVSGPYVGGGLELFVDPHFAVGLDYKGHYYFGDDKAGKPVDGACGQLSANITFYW